MKSTTTYLTFDGNCRDAMTFYAKCLGAELTISTFAEAPGDAAPGAADRIMHSRLIRNGVTLLMASDSMPGSSAVQVGFNFSIAIECESTEEIDTTYAALCEGGQATMPLVDAFWGARFGMLLDKFSIQWMLNFDKPKA